MRCVQKVCAWWSILNAVCILIIAYLTRTSKNVWKNYYSYKIKLLLLRFSWRCFCRFSNHFTIYISWECIPCIIIVVGKTLNNLVAVFIWELLLGQILWIVSSLLQIFLTWIWFICYVEDYSTKNIKCWMYNHSSRYDSSTFYITWGIIIFCISRAGKTFFTFHFV